mmetsp:Transcript_77573/g.169816  ORF Transcript_77573/g.169816 Transcript_77573/m.169816 type:complete len:102 (+) Transcript_77573:291-596(+)
MREVSNGHGSSHGRIISMKVHSLSRIEITSNNSNTCNPSTTSHSLSCRKNCIGNRGCPIISTITINKNSNITMTGRCSSSSNNSVSCGIFGSSSSSSLLVN